MSEDSNPDNNASGQSICTVPDLPSVKQGKDSSTPEAKSDDSISSEAPSKDPEFEMLTPADFEDREPATLTKSPASSLCSFTEVESPPRSPGIEVTMEHSDMKKLLHEAGKESGESSNETEENGEQPDNDIDKEGNKQNERLENDCVKNIQLNKDGAVNDGAGKNNALSETGKALSDDVMSETAPDANEKEDHLRPGKILSTSDGKELVEENKQESTSDQNKDISDGKPGKRKDSLFDFSKVSTDDDAAIFSSITYLGSTTVNAPVSDTELKRTMAILKEQSRVAVEVVLSVSISFDGFVKLLDPQNKTVIATYELQKILFCGRGDDGGNEQDCFAFNTCHDNGAHIFHCHVFRCFENGAVSGDNYSTIIIFVFY